MARILLAVVALALVPQGVRAGGKADFKAVQERLEEAYFDRLAPAERDRLFTALGAWDHPKAARALGEVASRFGAYLNGIEAKIAAARKSLEAFVDRPNVTAEEAERRNALVAELERLEEEWRRGRGSLDLLARVLAGYAEDSTVRFALKWDNHPSWTVRWLLATASARWHRRLQSASMSKRLFKSLAKLRDDEEPRVRLAVTRSLGEFHRREALPLLEKSLADTDWRVRAAAIRSLERTRSNEGVTLLIAAMKKEQGRLRDDISAALRRLTGENFTYVESWENWWRGVGEELPREAKAGAGAAEAEERREQREKISRFYGIPTRSDHVCYIIDVSGSMNKAVEPFDPRKIPVITGRKQPRPEDLPAPGKTRIEVARNELKRAVRNLPSRAYFAVVFFNHGVRVWRKEMTQATPENKEALIRDLDAVRASGSTYTLGALRQAFTMAGKISAPGRTKREGEGIDTIFLLSDGGPTDNDIDEPQPMDPDKILDTVHQWNKDAGIVIHTIAVDTEEVGTYFLSRLAEQNGGRFVERRQ